MAMAMLERILVLCVGNVCRSPMAAALLDRALAEAGRPRTLRSAGIAAAQGAPADPYVADLMAARGISLAEHRAAQVDPGMVRDADLILVMEQTQRRWLLGMEPVVAGKTFLLGHWDGQEIADPYLGAPADYARALALIDAGVAAWASRL